MVLSVRDVRTHFPMERPLSHPQRQTAELARSPGRPVTLHIESWLAEKPGKVLSLCGLILHLENTASLKEVFWLYSSVEGEPASMGTARDAGNHKPRVTDFARVKPTVCHVKSFFFFSSTIFHDGLESASIYFLEEKYACVYICNIDPVLSSTRF